MEYQEFKSRLDGLFEVIVERIGYFTASRGLLVEDEYSAHALNRYRGFFLPARDSWKMWRTWGIVRCCAGAVDLPPIRVRSQDWTEGQKRCTMSDRGMLPVPSSFAQTFLAMGL